MNNKIPRRSKNFSDREKAVLVRLIEQNAHILENKKTDALSNKIKKETWENITAQFNAYNSINADFSGPRDSKQLRILYDNMKRTVRKELAEENKIKSLIRMNPFVNEEAKPVVKEQPELSNAAESRLSENIKEEITIIEQKPTACRGDNSRDTPGSSASEIHGHYAYTPREQTRKKLLSKKCRLIRASEIIKKKYLMKKLQIANFEFRSKVEQHALDIEIKKLQLELLKKQLNNIH